MMLKVSSLYLEYFLKYKGLNLVKKPNFFIFGRRALKIAYLERSFENSNKFCYSFFDWTNG